MRIEAIPIERDRLGESPFWDFRVGALFWADQLGRKVRRYDPSTGEVHEWMAPDILGCVVPTSDPGRVLVAQPESFALLDLATGALEPFVTIPQPRPGVRLNDGRCDRAGRLISGSVTMDGGEGAGRIWRIGGDRKVELIRDGMVIVNAVCCTSSGDALHYADSRGGLLYRRECDPETGILGEETVIADVRSQGGAPDGATVDADGAIWTALIMPGKILRILPDGTIDRVISTPAPHTSSLAFGGPDLDVLYVTTVRETGMLITTDHPDAGKLFAIHGLGVTGVPEAVFDLSGRSAARGAFQ